MKLTKKTRLPRYSSGYPILQNGVERNRGTRGSTTCLRTVGRTPTRSPQVSVRRRSIELGLFLLRAAATLASRGLPLQAPTRDTCELAQARSCFQPGLSCAMTPTEGRATFRNMMESIAALHATGRAHGHLSRRAFDGSGQLVSPTGQMLVRRGSEQDGRAQVSARKEVTGWCPFTAWQVEMSQGTRLRSREARCTVRPRSSCLVWLIVLRCSHSPDVGAGCGHVGNGLPSLPSLSMEASRCSSRPRRTSIFFRFTATSSDSSTSLTTSSCAATRETACDRGPGDFDARLPP